MTSFDGDDGSGGGKNVGRVDSGSGSKVSGYTNSLEDTRSLDHSVGAGEGSVKVVVAGLDGLSTSTCDGGHQSGDVSSLSLTNAHEGLDLAVSKAKSLEVARGELGETLLVECRLEVLSGQSAELVSFGGWIIMP